MLEIELMSVLYFWLFGMWSSAEITVYPTFSFTTTSLMPTKLKPGHTVLYIHTEYSMTSPYCSLLSDSHLYTRHTQTHTQVCLAYSPILPAIFTGYLPNRGMLEIFIALMALYIGLRSSVRGEPGAVGGCFSNLHLQADRPEKALMNGSFHLHACVYVTV